MTSTGKDVRNDAIAEETGESSPIHANASQKGLARNVLSGYLATAVTTLTGFLVTPLLLRYLGKDLFGLWMLLLSLVAYIGLIESGLYASVSRRVAECLAHGDRERLGQVLGTAFSLYLKMDFLVVLLVLVLLPFLDRVFHLPAANVQAARVGLLFLGAQRCLILTFMPPQAALFGAGRFDLMTMATTLVNLTVSIASVVLAFMGFGIVSLAVCMIVGTLITAAVNYRLLRRHLPDIHISLKNTSPKMAKELIQNGSRVAMHSIAGNLAYGSDTLIIGMLLPIASVGHYAIAAKLSGMVSVLASKFNNVLLPAYSHADAQQDRTRQFRLFSQSISVAIAICLPLTLSVCFFGDRIIRAWVGAGHQAALPVCIILMIIVLLAQPGNACAMLMNATDRNLFLARAYVLAAPVNLFLSYLLTQKFGLIGPAVGSLTTIVIVDFTLLPVVVCNQFGFQYGAYWRECLGTTVLPLLAGGLTAWGLRRMHLPEGRLPTLFMLVLVIAVCWATWLRFGMRAEQRQSYLNVLKRLRR